MRVFDASNAGAGTFLYDLSMTGTTWDVTGISAAAITAGGKIAAYSNTSQAIVIWSSDSSAVTATQGTWGGGLAANFTTVGETIVSAGASNGGPITINDPGSSGNYNLTATFGNTFGPNYGGKSGVTATPDKLYAFGSDIVGATGPVGARNGIHQWRFVSGSWSQLPGNFQGNIAGTTNTTAGADVAVDQSQNLLFALNATAKLVTCYDLGDPNAAGDETLLGKSTPKPIASAATPRLKSIRRISTSISTFAITLFRVLLGARRLER